MNVTLITQLNKSYVGLDIEKIKSTNKTILIFLIKKMIFKMIFVLNILIKIEFLIIIRK